MHSYCVFTDKNPFAYTRLDLEVDVPQEMRKSDNSRDFGDLEFHAVGDSIPSGRDSKGYRQYKSTYGKFLFRLSKADAEKILPRAMTEWADSVTHFVGGA